MQMNINAENAFAAEYVSAVSEPMLTMGYNLISLEVVDCAIYPQEDSRILSPNQLTSKAQSVL